MKLEAVTTSAARRPIFARRGSTQTAWAAAAAATEMLAIAVSTYGAFAVYNLATYGAIPDGPNYRWASLLLATVYGGLCLADNQYDLLGPEWNQHSMIRGLGTIGLAFTFLLAIGFVTDTIGGYSRGTFLTQLAVGALAQVVTRTGLWQVIDQARKRGRWRRAGVVMLTLPGANCADDLNDRLSTKRQEIFRSYKLFSTKEAGTRPDGQIAEIQRECRMLRVDAVLIVFDADDMELVKRVVSAFSELPVRIQLLPIGIAEFMQRSHVGHCGGLRVLETFCRPHSLSDRLLKRSLDLVAATTLGLATLPLLAIVAILIKLESPGPILFRQTRHGFNNEPIQVLKFRTMVDGEDEDGFRQTVRGDPRVTRVGRLLRRANIDELPQLINVIRGDMSMVGPRPHAVAHNDMFADQIRNMSRRHNVKPGITGWAQVNGFRGETDTIEKMQKRVEYDLYYIDNWSLLFDLKIMIMTVLSRSAFANAY